ncbi:MAG: FecR domain-containing protein [Candidatus Marinimicrobia bacterium]|nr:FecR domain-containing protein [Candidatus Neomarinimicrobiota bacterium]
MKRLIIGLLLISVTAAYGVDKVAFATKVNGRVTITDVQKQTIPLKRGTTLNAGEKIETGSDGTAVIMFIDDKTILRIQKNTTLTVGGEISGQGANRALSKQIDLQFGKLRAQVAEQRRGEFQIVTPTSVASVKGTDFWTTSDPVIGDVFLGVSGLIEVENLISGGVISVGGGQVGSSGTDGETSVATYVLLVGELLSVSDNLITMEAAGDEETGPQFSGQIILNDQTTFAGPDLAVGGTATVSGMVNDDGSVTAIQVEMEEIGEAETEAVNELRIELEDADGNTKEVIILYQ